MEELKNRILMEMVNIINCEDIKKLKRCLDRNFYGYTITENSTDIIAVEKISNEKMLLRFQFERSLEGISQKSLKQYIRESNKFLLFVNKHYSDVTSEDIQYYLFYLMDCGTMSATSVDNSRKFLKAFFKWLYENEFITKDLFLKIKPIKRIEKQKDFLTNNEIVSIRDSAKDDIRALALIDTLLSTGLRVSECSNLKISDINFEKDEITVYATKTNTWRKVYLDSYAKEHLRSYLMNRKDNNPYVFVNIRKCNGSITKMSNGSIEKLIQKYCYKIINRHCSVHLFRKTLATRLKRMGMDITDIAKLLGHKSIKTTEQFYLTVCDNDIHYMYMKCS